MKNECLCLCMYEKVWFSVGLCHAQSKDVHAKWIVLLKRRPVYLYGLRIFFSDLCEHPF